MRRTLAERFSEYCDTPNAEGCVLWLGSKRENGYGIIVVNGRKQSTHRVVWELTYGTIPEDLMVRHYVCGNRACVNVEHLRLGTHQDNMDDMVRQGRAATGDRHSSRTHPERVARGDRNGSRKHPESVPRGDKHYARTQPERLARGDTHGSKQHPELVPRGERSGNTELTEADVQEIFNLREKGYFQRVIGEKFGMTQAAISLILLGRNWGHVAQNRRSPHLNGRVDRKKP